MVRATGGLHHLNSRPSDLEPQMSRQTLREVPSRSFHARSMQLETPASRTARLAQRCPGPRHNRRANANVRHTCGSSKLSPSWLDVDLISSRPSIAPPSPIAVQKLDRKEKTAHFDAGTASRDGPSTSSAGSHRFDFVASPGVAQWNCTMCANVCNLD